MQLQHLYSHCSLGVLLGLIVWVAPAPTVQAVETLEGTVVTATETRVTVRTMSDFVTVSFFVPPTAKITLDGKPAKLSEIKTGDLAKLTVTNREQDAIATVIDARTPY